MKKLFKKLIKVKDEAVKDPEIVAALAVPHKTKTGLFCKIAYILLQLFDIFKRTK